MGVGLVLVSAQVVLAPVGLVALGASKVRGALAPYQVLLASGRAEVTLVGLGQQRHQEFGWPLHWARWRWAPAHFELGSGHFPQHG